jgi:hypothetical protein
VFRLFDTRDTSEDTCELSLKLELQNVENHQISHNRLESENASFQHAPEGTMIRSRISYSVLST